jgi:hypothetical protein
VNEQQIAVQDDGRVTLDLSHNMGIIRRGDVTVWKTWVLIDNRWQACLALTPTRMRASHERVVPCVVPQSRAWVWAEETGNEFDAMITAGIFCANLGFNPFNPKNVTKVMGIVRDLLHELLIIPPRPDKDKIAAAEIDIFDNVTGKIRQAEVFDEPA